MKRPEDLSEEQLFELLVRRDQRAFLQIYRVHAPLVGRVLARLGIAPQDIEDAVQTTFVEALASVERFEGRSSIRSWLLRVALNQARNQIRSRIRARRAAPMLTDDEAESPSTEALMSERQQLDRLQRALNRIPEIQREALVLCELSGLPTREVSAMLGVPAGTIWRRVHDAKKSLRELLEEGEP